MKHCLGSVRSFVLFAALCLLFAGCGDSVASVRHPSGDGRVPVRLVVAGMDSPSRTIAPAHVLKEDLADSSKYTVTLTGTSNMGDSISLNPAGFSFGQIGFDLSPGTWSLLLEATEVATGKRVLSGSCVLVVQSKPVSATVTLTPVTGETGTVNVQFTLSKSIMEKLDKTGSNATITVALYDTLKAEVAGTKQVFSEAVPAGDSTTLTYRANNSQLAAGQYTIKLESGYTGPGPLGGSSVTYEMGHEDILYVEGNRETTASIALSSDSKELGTPDNPYRRDKVAASVTVPSTNGNTSSATDGIITGTQTSNPYEEGLWTYPANWDGSGSNAPRNPNGQNGGHGGITQGNEVLLITWDAVYNADYYELEVLLHPKYGYNINNKVHNSAKYEKLPVSDSDWQQFLGKSPSPIQLQFSGRSGDPNNYKTKVYTHTIYVNTDAATQSYDFVAWRDIATGRNNGYKTTTTSTDSNFIFPPDGTGLSRKGNDTYRIGLEGNCNALAILLHNYTPMHWYGIRVRGVNQYGHSGWVYWKGGMR